MRLVPVLLIATLPFLAGCRRAPVRASGPLAHDGYLWQRTHSAAVSESVRTHADAFRSIIVLAAEVSWQKSAANFTPQITRVSLDWPALRTAPHLGLALRLNAHPGPFARADPTARALAALASELLAEATVHGATVSEFQIDFDAATGKLAGYRAWLDTLRAAIAPVPLTFTALPAWLRSGEFPALARSAAGFVLQVHSLARPAGPDTPFALCDPAAARLAIERAALVGLPFRVALPTYGYTLAFDSTGRFAALSAEGPRPEWREDFIVREIRADASELAALVNSLTADRPAALSGLIWYRLPVAGDQLNWSWPTLASAMRGQAPAARLRAEAQLTTDGPIELLLVNDGDGDFSGPARVGVRWHDARRTGADALGAFAIADEDASSLHFATATCRLPAGTRRAIGWLRLSSPTVSPDVFLEN